MPPLADARDPLELLLALEREAQAHPEIVSEWEQALATFSGGARDPGTLARFREWFLLERDSEHLGAPPAIAWSPPALEPDDPWERLLDSFLGIFQPAPAQPESGLALEDLWSGRMVVTDAPHEMVAGDGWLFLGRFVLDAEGRHRALPGLAVIQASGLSAALERDLAAARAKNPRGRLSQLEVERLFAAFLHDAAAGDSPEDLAALESELQSVLRCAPGWTVERLRELLVREGAGETLNALAFESEVDLDALRRLLPAYAASLESFAAQADVDPPRRGGGAADDPAAGPVGEVEAALAHFDAGRAAGRPLDSLFDELETELGLEPRSTADLVPAPGAAPDVETAEEAPRAPQSFGIWVETFAWERERAGSPLARIDQQTLERLARFLDAEGFGTELRGLGQAHVLAFLLRTRDAAELAVRRASLEPFLRWASEEQEAPLAGFLAALDQELGLRLERVVVCNAELARLGREARSRAPVCSTQPLGVRAEAGEIAPLVGLPEGFEALPVEGDTVLGTWHAGTFELAALVPRELAAAG